MLTMAFMPMYETAVHFVVQGNDFNLKSVVSACAEFCLLSKINLTCTLNLPWSITCLTATPLYVARSASVNVLVSRSRVRSPL